MTELLANLEGISVSDRLGMIQTIWDSIESSHQTLPLSKTQEQELNRRFAAHRAKPDDVVPWDEIKSELLP